MTAVALDATPSRVRTAWLVPALVIVIAACIAWWAAPTYVVGVFHDDGIYALLARSIAAGEGFHYSHLPGAPAATHYPPLYPLVLAAVWRLAPDFPDNLRVLLGLNALLVAAAAFGWWRFATARLAWHSGKAAAGALLATLASPTLALAGALLSESLFLALLWPALLLSEHDASAPDGARPWVTGSVLGALMLVRTHALALLVAFVVVLAVQRRWRHAASAFLAASVVQLPWQLWTHWATPRVAAPLEGAYGSYLGWFATGLREGGLRFLLATMRVNAVECWLLLQDRLALGLPASLHLGAELLALAAMVAGGFALRRRAAVTIAFFVVYLLIILVWPYTPWRFLWAVWPLVALLIFEGVRWSSSASGRWRLVPVLAAALPALAFLRTELHAYATRSWRVPARHASAQIAPVVDWVRANTAPTDVVLSEGEQVIALYAGRRAAPPIAFTAREYLSPPGDAESTVRLRAMLAAVPARYLLLLAPPMIRAADGLRRGHPGLRRIAALTGGAVYEVVP